MAESWALIRKTQSHIITLDETKEDNPVVCLGCAGIKLLLLSYAAQAFCSRNALNFSQTDALMWTYLSKGSPLTSWSGPMLAFCGSTAEKAKQINTVSMPCLLHLNL